MFRAVSILIPPDKDSQSRTYFLDIKSKSLRGTLREVLRNVRVANLRDEQPSVVSSKSPLKDPLLMLIPGQPRRTISLSARHYSTARSR